MRKRASQFVQQSEPIQDEGDLPADRQFVVALQRGLDILKCFRPTDGSLGNQELADRTGLPKATVSRLTYTLSKLGYLIYLDGIGKYRMGIPVLGLGYACLGGLKFRETAQPYMQELANFAGEGTMVSLGGRDAFSMIYIACARSEGLVSLQLNVGSHISLTRSGMGWAYVTALAEEERRGLLNELRDRIEATRWAKFEDGLERARQDILTKGFCTNLGDWHPQVNSVAAPLRLPHQDMPVLAFNCGGPSYVLPPKRLEEEIGPRLVTLARTVAAAGGVL